MGVASESTGNGRRAKAKTAAPPPVEQSGTFGRRKLGRYLLQQELGRGTTGVVYEARDTRSDAVVALKTLASTDAENLFRLKHEFRSLANLEHESFVRFGELACEDGEWFFTMERIHGRDFLRHVDGADVAPRDPGGTAKEAAALTPEKERRL